MDPSPPCRLPSDARTTVSLAPDGRVSMKKDQPNGGTHAHVPDRTGSAEACCRVRVKNMLPEEAGGDLSAPCVWPDQFRHWYNYQWTCPPPARAARTCLLVARASSPPRARPPPARLHAARDSSPPALSARARRPHTHARAPARPAVVNAAAGVATRPSTRATLGGLDDPLAVPPASVLDRVLVVHACCQLSYMSTKLQCIPLSDGSFSSIADGPIWLNDHLLDSPSESKISTQSFPVLYNNLRIVSPHILSMSCKNSYIMEEMKTDYLIDILLKIGVRKFSGHDIIKNHILVSLSNATDANAEEKTMTEYLSFIMLHLQSSCTSCNSGKEEIVSELRKRPVLLTNNGYKCPADVPIHFSKHYRNLVDIGKLLQNLETTWIELDTCYLRHHSSASLQFKLKSWRQFFEELGVTDFVQVVKVKKNISEVDYVQDGTPSQDGVSGTPCIVYDWESPELANFLSIFSSKKLRENCIYLLKVLDKTWDDYYSMKSRSLRNATHCSENIIIESSFMKSLRNFKWIASSMDEDLHYARDLFCDLANVRSLLGSVAPYAKPMLSSKSLRKDIGFKAKVSYSDALLILNHWIASHGPFSARLCIGKQYSMVQGTTEKRLVLLVGFYHICNVISTRCRDTYNNFQQNETMKLSSLEVIVVQKLFFKYMLKGRDSSSKRRFECHCLLQGNILYATQEADPHSVLLELSRVFFGGSSDLHFANFLHMVKTMSDSGSTMDQIEFFIVNNRKVPLLPEQESVWSFSSSFVAKEIFTSQTVQLQPLCEPSHTLKRKSSPEIISSQPASKKSSPDLTTSHKSQQEIKVNDMTSPPQLSKPVETGHTEDTSVPVKVEGDHVVKEDLTRKNNMLAGRSTMEVGDEPTCLDLEAASSPSPVDQTELTDVDEKLGVAQEKDNTDTGAPCGSELGAGTPGEAAAQIR